MDRERFKPFFAVCVPETTTYVISVEEFEVLRYCISCKERITAEGKKSIHAGNILKPGADGKMSEEMPGGGVGMEEIKQEPGMKQEPKMNQEQERTQGAGQGAVAPGQIPIEVRIDARYTQPRIIIMTDRVTEEVSQLLQRLSEESPRMIAGFREGRVELLEQADIIRVHASGGKVYATTEKGEFQLRLRLYEMEERVDKKCFVRISNSEIVNLRKVKSFDLSFSGTICVSLSNGCTTYVSRRYMAKIKQALGI